MAATIPGSNNLSVTSMNYALLNHVGHSAPSISPITLFLKRIFSNSDMHENNKDNHYPDALLRMGKRTILATCWT
jgi:hypothetical protein